MMNGLFTAITATLLLTASLFAQHKPDREKANLLGPVRSVHSQMTSYIDEKSQETEPTKQLDTVLYDPKGNEIERTIYDDYGFLAGKEVHTFDANDNLMGSVLSDPEGAVMQRQVYAYPNGKLTQIVSYDGKGKVGLKQINAYGENGKLREETYYEQKAVGKTLYKYDSKGNLSEVAFYMADGSKAVAPIGACLGAHRVTYSYDGKDQLTRMRAYEPDGQVKKSWRYAYNSRREQVEDLRETDWSRTTFAYTYEYDAHQNWIKQFATVTDQSKSNQTEPYKRKMVISREITYY
ncbi:MAG: hypothetical protein QOD75_2835 [Blastocatellia bacterium]|jgi:antitoxin component YwqK of YwqJK toxin-antitoxin module|nr:hypothetical protein [Blastocatellia bacterium]